MVLEALHEMLLANLHSARMDSTQPPTIQNTLQSLKLSREKKYTIQMLFFIKFYCAFGVYEIYQDNLGGVSSPLCVK